MAAILFGKNETRDGDQAERGRSFQLEHLAAAEQHPIQQHTHPEAKVSVVRIALFQFRGLSDSKLTKGRSS